MSKTLLLAILVAATSLPGMARAASADDAFAETREAYQALKKDPERRKFRHHWLNMARKLEAFGKRYPKSERTPDVLYLSGDLYATLWRFSQDPDDLKSAEQSWRKLVEGFPSHRLADDAALQLARQLADRKGELEEARRVVEAALPHARDRKKELEELLVGLKEARKKPAASEEPAVARKGAEEKGAAHGKDSSEEKAGASREEAAVARRGAEEKGAAHGKNSSDEKAGASREEPPVVKKGADEKGAAHGKISGDEKASASREEPAVARKGADEKGPRGKPASDEKAAAAHRDGQAGRGPGAAPVVSARGKPAEEKSAVAKSEPGRKAPAPLARAARASADSRDEAGAGDDRDTAPVVAAAKAPPSAGGRAQDVLAAIRKVSAKALRTTAALDAGVDGRHAARLQEANPEDERSDAVEEQGQSSPLQSLQERLRDVRVGAGSRKVDDAVARSRVKGLTQAEAATEVSLAQQLGLKVRRVVVDAGHGGHDTGAIGPRGTREKDVALSIAKRLAARLEKLGLEVVLTRDDDSFVALEERTQIANREKGDLFISVHCNAAPQKTLRGVETYSLNTASNRYAVRLAARENASSERGVSDLQYILADLATKANTGESERLAQRVQKSLVRQLNEKHPGVRDLGPKQALFFVLLGAKMPAILVETSFISNPQEEELLGSEAYQDDAADGVAGAVQDFLEERNRVAQVD
jgi:N-acetylmuramoyl-L-alanine amidase